MADSYTPLDRDAVAAILADYIVLGTHVAVESAIDEATDRIVDLVGRGARDRARRAEHPLTVEQAPRLGWWGEAIDVDGEPTAGIKRAVLTPACGIVLDYPLSVPGADRFMVDVRPVREAQ